MNKIILILACAFITLSANSQDIPKKANTIIVQGTTFEQVANLLMDKGYMIDKSDAAMQTILTKEKVGKNNIYITLFVRIKDSAAIIKGTCTNKIAFHSGMVTLEASEDEIAYRSLEMSLWKMAFRRMNDLALSFGKPVEYLVQ